MGYSASRIRPRPLAGLLVLLAAIPLPARPDVLLLKDGKRVEGTVTETGDGYEVKTPYGSLTLRKEDVSRRFKDAASLTAEIEFLRRSAGEMAGEGFQVAGDDAARDQKLEAAAALYEKAIALCRDARQAFPNADLDRTAEALAGELRKVRSKITPATLEPVAPPKSIPPVPVPPAKDPVVPPALPVPASGLLAHWKLNEGAGTTAKDASGNGRHGLLKGGAEWATVGRRHGVRFDGKTGFIDTGAPLPDLSRPFSFAFWINPGDTQKVYAIPLGNHHRPDEGGTVGASFEQSESTTNAFWLVIGTTDSWAASKPLPLTPGVWQHVAAVCDGRQAVLYLDGVEKVRSPMRAVPLPNRVDTFKLGAGAFPNRFFNGLLGDVRIYAGALTAEEVAELARAASDATPAVRLPLPAGAALADAEKEIRSLFKEEYAKRAAADRVALARNLLRAGGETKESAALRFVAFREARDIAAGAADFATACAAIDRLDAVYDVDGPEMKAAAFASAARAAEAEEAEALFAAGMDLADRLARGDEYDAVFKLMTPLEDLARRMKSAEHVKTVQARAKDLRAQQTEWNRVRPSLDKLKESPDDAEACLAAGRYYVLVRKWSEALPLLAKGGTAALPAAAAKELAKPADAAALAEAGDLWTAAAEKETGALKPLLQERARDFYEKALPGLTGLAKARVEKRLEDQAKAAAQRLSIPASCVLFLDFDNAVSAKRDGKDVQLLRDLSPAGNHAVLEGGGRLVPGPRGRSAVLTGAAAIRMEKPLATGNEWTIAFHVNLEGPWAGQRCVTTVAAWHHQIIVRPGGILASCAESGEISLSAADLSTMKGWHHVAAVGRGGETVFYVDGKEAGRTKSQEKGPIVLIGNYLSGDYPMVNPIDNFTVFRAALPPDAIQSLARR